MTAILAHSAGARELHVTVNYITIRGFHMSQAATQWAAPTAEQIGLIIQFGLKFQL